ncbi:MAG TPA: extracellular solute-binding protein [Streptosporangiaceae bacterium]|jgi:raffinose/stachyose/melibiose transport system substrate-binding protein
MPKPDRRRTAMYCLAVVAALATACAPGSGHGKSASKAPAAVRTDIGKLGPVTLTVWDQEVRGGQNEQMRRLNAAFQAKYPNVTIKRVSRSFPDLQKTLRLALSGDNPPDVVEANQGYGAMAQFVKAGLLLPLDPYLKAYGWRDRYPKSLLDINSVTRDGRSIGSGSLYGLSLNGEIVGIFYNKQKLTKLGLRPPATWGEFEQVLGRAKGKGELPIAFGNLDKFPGIHEYGVIQDQLMTKDTVRSLVYGKGGSWTDPPNLAAARTLADWSKRGYLTKDANSVKYDDSPVNFAKGQGVFLIGGTWFAADLQAKMHDNVGFMLPPPVMAGGQSATMGGESLPWAITSKTKHADVAAAYLNFLTTPAAMDIATESGVLPAIKPASKQPDGALMKQVFAAWQTASDTNGLTPYLDYATTDFGDVLGGALQKLIAGKATPEKALDEAQKDYADFLQKK